ncbi:MAG: archease [Bacteroidetes bacterium]|nr:archease [Rhodothermia bacterium]MCS7155499.1 archease [Bacteroidota bacterium]MCX7907408.1 archease [Bacteroidota bacterium]MDW8138402.1 archease [Bacteroidota bacterium]MDW8284661.1 archease [Bacteroidota bacterium]
MGYSWIPHTADVALRLWGADPAALYVEAARGLVDEMTDGALEGAQPRQWRSVRLCAASYAELLVDWLNELIFWYEAHALYPVAFRLRAEVRSEGYCLLGEVGVVPVGEQVAKLQLKAATYHGLRFAQAADGTWEAEVVLDI